MQDRKPPAREPKPLTDEEGEVRELMVADMVSFRPATDCLPQSLVEKLGIQTKNRQKETTVERISVTLSRDVVDRFRATGNDWQTRLEAVLREWLEIHSIG
jgi:uncharacterized protein (DUF4415 family)